MKKIAIVFAAIVAIVLGGCQNNGDIGRLFGSWRLDQYLVNGEQVTEVSAYGETVPVKNIVFSFQSSVIKITTNLDDYLSYYSAFGSWKEEGDQFTIDFTHVDANTEAGNGQYQAPKWIGLISDVPMVMAVSDSKSKSFTLTWDAPDGTVKTYKLSKTY